MMKSELYSPSGTTEKIVKLLKTFRVEGAKKFVARDHFKKDTSKKLKVKILSILDDFNNNLLDLIEEDVPEVELKAYQLLRGSCDPGITVELGEHYTVSLAHVWSALSLQPNGEAGNLLVNGAANIFYVADINNVVWAVVVDWSNGGWSVDAYSIDYPYDWSNKYQIIAP